MRVVSPTAFLGDTQDAGTNRVATRFRQPRKHMYRLNWGLLSVGKSRTSNPSRHGCIVRPNVSGERRERLCHCVTQQNHPDLAGSSSIFTASHPQILHVTLNCHWTSCRWALGAGGKIHILSRYPWGLCFTGLRITAPCTSSPLIRLCLVHYDAVRGTQP